MGLDISRRVMDDPQSLESIEPPPCACAGGGVLVKVFKIAFVVHFEPVQPAIAILIYIPYGATPPRLVIENGGVKLFVDVAALSSSE